MEDIDSIFFGHDKRIPQIDLLYNLPISGSFFPAQLAFLCELSKIGMPFPNLMLGGSGGNVSAYIGLASGFCEANILKIANVLHHSIFVEKNILYNLRLINFIKKGHVYKHSKTSESFFNQIMIPAKMKRVEIITVSYCLKRRRCVLHSNYDEKNSIFDKNDEITFLEGDPENISKVIMASANIPLMFPKISLLDDHLVDPCISRASPLPVLGNRLKNRVKRLIHFCPRAFSNKQLDQMSIAEVTSSMTLSIAHIDIYAVASIFDMNNAKKHVVHNCDYRELGEQIKRMTGKNFILIFFPTENVELSLVSFVGKQITEAIDFYRRRYGIYLIYWD